MFAVVYGYVNDNDYHKTFDKPMLIRYNCDMTWDRLSPDVPQEVIDKCKVSEKNYVYIKTYQEEHNR